MTIKISYKDQDRTIQLSELPEFDRETAELLEKTDAVQRNAVLKNYKYGLTATLKERAASIETVSSALSEIQEHKTREVICACLKTLFVCAMIAGTVLLGVFGGEFAILCVLGIFVYMLLSGYMSAPSAVKLLQFDENSPWCTDYNTLYYNTFNSFKASITLPFFALFLPLYEVLTRQDRIERVQNKQNTEMNTDLGTFLKFTEELSTNLKEIRKQLLEEQTKKTARIDQTQKLDDPGLQEALKKLGVEIEWIQETQKALSAFEECHARLLGNQ